MQTGMARPNQFRVDLQFPDYVSGGANAAQLGRFHCKATSLPSSTVSPVPIYFLGRQVNVAGEREFQPWTITIYNENFRVRDAFEQWSNGFNNITNNTGILSPTQYQRDMTCVQLDRNGLEIKKYVMIDCFPIQVGEIQLDFEANNQVEMFQVVMQYNFFTSSNVNVSA